MGLYDSIRSLVPKRSRRTLTDERMYDCYIGQAIPIECRDCVPGDNLKVYNHSVVKLQPMVAPVLGQLYYETYYFFVPYRLLDRMFEYGITGIDEDGNEFEYAFPRVSNFGMLYSVQDYLGFPIKENNTTAYNTRTAPTRYSIRAYNLIFNEWVRDENLEDKRDLDEESIYSFNLKKDYFSSALLTQQKGTAPALPVTGHLPIFATNPGTGLSAIGYNLMDTNFEGSVIVGKQKKVGENYFVSPDSATSTIMGDYPQLFADASDATTFDIAELRTAVQIQKILERQNRTGSRYTEYLRSFFSVAPSDERLQRPEFVGGTKTPVIINEVLQTSTSQGSTPQGTMTGHGMSVNAEFVGKYFVKEYGCLMGIAVLRPRVLYSQGINRQFIKNGRYDFYLPQLCNLSEQGIYNAEIYADGSEADEGIFGFQGNFNEMRSGTSFVCGGMRDKFSYWHFGRKFGTRPTLSEPFIKVNHEEYDKIFAVQNEPEIIVQSATILDAVRPITAVPEPGRMDHDM